MNPTDFEQFFKKNNNFDKTLGLKFKILSPGHIEYYLKIEERHLSSPQYCHGGVIAGMMDAVLGLTVISYAITLDKFCSTVELKTNFLTPASLGQELKGSALIDFKGQSLVVCSGNIADHLNSEKMVAKGIGTFSLYPASKHTYFENFNS